MRKVLLLLAVLCMSCTTAFALNDDENQTQTQTEVKKSWQGDIAKKWEFRGRVGGFWGYTDHHTWANYADATDRHQDDWFATFEAGFGYNFTNKFYAGVEGGFWWKAYPFYGVPAGDAASANLVLNYRFFKENKRWQWFIQGRGGYAWGTSSDRTVMGITDGTPNSGNLEIMPGVNFRLRENIDLVLGIGYQHLWNRGSEIAYDNENGIIAKVGINIRKKSAYVAPVPVPEPVAQPVEEPVKEEPVAVEEPAPAPAPAPEPAPVVVEEVKPCIQNVFFLINRYDIRPAEMAKVEECVAYLNKYPQAKINLTGYADKNTGNYTINQRLSKQRVNAVYDELVRRGVDPARITKSYKGDTEQPFGNDEANYTKNRCTICVAE